MGGSLGGNCSNRTRPDDARQSIVVYVAIDALNNRRLLECQVLHSQIRLHAGFRGKLYRLREESGAVCGWQAGIQQELHPFNGS